MAVATAIVFIVSAPRSNPPASLSSPKMAAGLA
jgi:hypothetical protein